MLNIENSLKPAPQTQISKLIAKAENQSIINMSTDPIDWTLPVSIPKWLSEDQYICLVSNLIYGEKSTVRACKILQSQFNEGIFYNFLETQISDEEKHAKIYHQYLDKLGHNYSPSPKWCALIEECIEKHKSPIELVIAFHILLEGEAVFLQKLISEYVPCPLFSDINNNIRLDEARHVAFGKIIFPELLKPLSEERKTEILKWAKKLWFNSAKILVTEYLDPSIVKSIIISQLLEIRWKKQKQLLQGLQSK